MQWPLSTGQTTMLDIWVDNQTFIFFDIYLLICLVQRKFALLYKDQLKRFNFPFFMLKLLFDFKIPALI